MMPSSLRFQIQRGFSRLVTKYAILSGGVLLLLVAVFVFYTARSNLVAQSDIVRTQLKSQISATLVQADTLIRSPVLWTGLMDSFGRETYLKPLLKQLNRNDDTKFVLLDYQGRVFVETPGASSDAIEVMRQMLPEMNLQTTAVQLLRTDRKNDLLLILLPITSPLSDAPLGYLMTQFSVTSSIHELNVDDRLQVDFNLQPTFASSINWWNLSEIYADQIVVGDYKLRYDTRYAVSLLPNMAVLLGLFVMTAMLGHLFVRRSKVWLSTFAAQLTAQLDQLVRYAQDIFAGKPVEIESVADRVDEIGTVVNTLEALLVTQAKTQEHLRKLAYEDALTGLPNFARFYEISLRQLDELARADKSLTFMFIDVNQLKHINDIYGHEAGNKVIQESARLLERVLPEPCMVSRRSGDEFIAWAEIDDQQLYSLSESVATFEVNFQNVAIPVTLTMGAARFPQDAQGLDDLIFCAEYALKQAKSRARQTYAIFNEQLGLRLIRNKQIEERIALAIRQCDIKPFYQPEVDMVTGQVTGFEALARWHDPKLGLICPDEFLPIVEHLRMFSELTNCMLTSILSDAAKIHTRFPGAKIAFNASPQDFQREHLLDAILSYAAHQPDGLAHFELELTEQDIVGLDEEIVRKLNTLIQVGIHVAIDDFGTKYSSLSRLTALPLHRLKIDLSFVSNITQAKGEEIVRLIVSLAKTLNLDITAEGVETIRQRDLLIACGCRNAQGWLYEKALSLSEVMNLPTALLPTETIRADSV